MPHRPANPILYDLGNDEDPITFGVGSEVFTALPQPTADAIRVILDPAYRNGGLAYQFIEAVLADPGTDDEFGSVARFRRACADRRTITPEKEIADIYLWLLSVYGDGHPTLPSSDSSTGLTPTPNGSTGGSLSQASTLGASASGAA